MRHASVVESTFIRTAASLLSAGRDGGRLAILTFHRVVPEPDPLIPGEPDVVRFTWLLDLLASCFNVLPLREAVERLRNGALPRRAVALTFDDGYANNCEIAMPVLRSRGLPATVFIATGYMNGGVMFNDAAISAIRSAPSSLDLREIGLGVFALTDILARRTALATVLSEIKYQPMAEREHCIRRLGEICGVSGPHHVMVNDEQVRRMHRGGMEIGAHTVTHPILAKVDRDQALREIGDSKRTLEQLIAAPVVSFAYPNGFPGRDYTKEHAELVRKAGYQLAVSTAWGRATRGVDPFQLPRIAVRGSSPLGCGLRLAVAYRDRPTVLAQ
jgi:peptidoglycan/xylan/chitin deacetylase (PgdA/CDA1 family)